MRTSGGIFDVESKADELKNIELSLTQEEIWSNLEKSTELNKRKSQIERSLEPFYQSETQIEDSKMLLDIAEEENDIQTISDIACLLYTSPSPRDSIASRMPSSA